MLYLQLEKTAGIKKKVLANCCTASVHQVFLFTCVDVCTQEAHSLLNWILDCKSGHHLANRIKLESDSLHTLQRDFTH